MNEKLIIRTRLELNFQTVNETGLKKILVKIEIAIWNLTKAVAFFLTAATTDTLSFVPMICRIDEFPPGYRATFV